MSYSTLSGYIKTLLQGVSGVLYVYDYEKPELVGYPCITVTATSSDVEDVDTANNFRNYTFTVRVYQEITKDGRGADNGERIMRTIVDSVIDKFDKDITLGGNCLMCRPVTGQWFWVDREKEHRAAEIEVKCLVKDGRS